MKNLFVLLSIVSILILSCSKDSKEDEIEDITEDTIKTYQGDSIRYEGYVSDPVKYRFRVLYIDDREEVIIDTVDNPFIHKFKTKREITLSLSVTAIPRVGLLQDSANVAVSAKLFINNKLIRTSTEQHVTSFIYFLGLEAYQD